MRINLKMRLLMLVVLLWVSAGVPSASGQIPGCTESALKAIQAQGLQADAAKAVAVLNQLDSTEGLTQKFGQLLSDIVGRNVAGGAVLPDALSRMLKMTQNYANPAIFSDTASSLQAMREDIEGIFAMRQKFGVVPEGIFNRAAGVNSPQFQPTAWLENASNANGLGQAFEIKGYQNLVDQGVLPGTQRPVFGQVFFTELGDLECDVLVAFICVDLKFTRNANFNIDGPAKAAQAIIDGEVNQVFYAVSPSASSAPGPFQDAVTQAAAAAKFGQNTLAIIDAGTF